MYVSQKIAMVSGRILDFKLQNITLIGLSRKKFVERILFGTVSACVIKGTLENPAWKEAGTKVHVDGHMVKTADTF